MIINSGPEIKPLTFPEGCPPVDPPMPALQATWASSIPLVGKWLEHHLQRMKYRSYRSHYFRQIEQRITDQLRVRPAIQMWPPELQSFVDILRFAIEHEKHIPCLAIHPDDPTDLLFWGAYDDLTPSIFTIEIEKKLGIKILNKEMWQFWQNHTTARDLMMFCADKQKSFQKK